MKRKSNAFAQVIVGVFMLTVLLLLGYFTIVISGVDILSGREKVQLVVAFDQVGGLKDHDNVMYRGTKVGVVDHVRVSPSNLVVIASVTPNVVLRAGYRITVCNLSMLGGNYMQVTEGDGERIEFVGKTLRGETPSDWMSDVSDIAVHLRNLTRRLEDSSMITNLEAASAAARSVAERVERGEGLVGRLTSSQDHLYEDLTNTVGDIRVTAANAREFLAQFDKKRIYADLQDTIADFRTMCSNITAASSSIARMSQGLEAKGLVEKTDAFLDGAKALAENLNDVAARLKAGEGTLGKLTSDEKLYQEVDGLIRDCRQVLDNYRDTTPVSTFTSLATGAL